MSLGQHVLLENKLQLRTSNSGDAVSRLSLLTTMQVLDSFECYLTALALANGPSYSNFTEIYIYFFRREAVCT